MVEDIAMGAVIHKVEVVEIVSFVEANIHHKSVLHTVRHVLNAIEKTILQKCKSRNKSQSQDHSKGQRQSRSKSKNRKFNEVVQSDCDDEGQYNDYVETKQEYDKVETLYYHNVAIQSSEQKHRMMCDLKMTLGAKSCLNQ